MWSRTNPWAQPILLPERRLDHLFTGWPRRGGIEQRHLRRTDGDRTSRRHRALGPLPRPGDVALLTDPRREAHPEAEGRTSACRVVDQPRRLRRGSATTQRGSSMITIAAEPDRPTIPTTIRMEDTDMPVEQRFPGRRAERRRGDAARGRREGAADAVLHGPDRARQRRSTRRRHDRATNGAVFRNLEAAAVAVGVTASDIAHLRFHIVTDNLQHPNTASTSEYRGDDHAPVCPHRRAVRHEGCSAVSAG